MRSVVLSATLAALTVIGCVSTHGQIYNGSFESGSYVPDGGWLVLAAGSSSVDGWTIDQGSIDYISGWWPASEGSRNLDLSGLNAGKVSQYVGTVPGSTYLVSFDLSGNSDGLPIVKQVTVTVDGVQPIAFYYDTAENGNTRTDMKWVRHTYTFVAQSQWTLLSFSSDVATPYGPTLDNVSMELIPIEEPLAGVCHRNNGKKGSKTLYVDTAAYPAHLAHGDSAGPCEAE